MAAQRNKTSMAQKNGHSSAVPADDGPPDAAPRSQSARDRARASGYQPAQSQPSRRPAGERENAFNALAWLLEGATGLLEEFRHNDLGLSEEFWVHASAARRESLLAMRAAIDTLLEKTDAAEAALQERQTRHERRGGIDIDF